MGTSLLTPLAPARTCVQAQAAEVLQAVPDLGSLFVRSVCDLQWMPQLAALTNLDPMFVWDPGEYAGAQTGCGISRPGGCCCAHACMPR